MTSPTWTTSGGRSTQFRPDLLVNLAAFTDLEFCELNPDEAWSSNALGAENGGRIARRLDIPYVYISSAGIFGGREGRGTTTTTSRTP